MALNSETVFDLAVVGAGPAGSAATITAARQGLRVLQVEAGSFPRHKVCGEFISAEAVALLRSLLRSADLLMLDQAPRICEVRLHADGKTARLPLRNPAISLSRAQLDLALWQSAQDHGATCEDRRRIKAVANERNEFRLSADDQVFHARAVVNCTGRWSELSVPSEQAANSNSGKRWIGIKGHFHEIDSPSTCDLYFFPSGYCGVLALKSGKGGIVNAAAMVRADIAKNFEELFSLEPMLEQRSRSWQPAFAPVTTSPLLFRTPQTSYDGALLAGDAAGFIDPFTGDGISLAIHCGIKAASAMNACLNKQVTLQQAIDGYDQWYRSNLLPAFSTARRLRQLQELPRFMRRLSLSLLNIPLLGTAAIGLTRVKGPIRDEFVRI